MKRIITFLLIMAFAISLCACNKEPSFVTYEDYKNIGEEDWQHMTPDDFTKFFGVKGVASEHHLGEGYIVYLYPGEEEDTGILVTFNDLDGDGTYYSNGFANQGLTE